MNEVSGICPSFLSISILVEGIVHLPINKYGLLDISLKRQISKQYYTATFLPSSRGF